MSSTRKTHRRPSSAKNLPIEVAEAAADEVAEAAAEAAAGEAAAWAVAAAGEAAAAVAVCHGAVAASARLAPSHYVDRHRSSWPG
jgi:hypothetical protein